ncbi:MAG TPA: hypothetical protein DIT07_05365 [Sphingobacteriaceae bacterium]|nr:hypothetical protein [Sphingobacteriaceae bacterium]
MRLIICQLLLISCVLPAFGQQKTDEVRRIPKIGIQVNDKDRNELESSLKELGQDIAKLKQKKDKLTTDLLPDVMIYHKAVDYALKYQEFFAEKDIVSAKNLLKEGLSRAEALSSGKSPWTTQKGEVTRGYISKIDGSVQPYALSIPENYTSGTPFNLSFWFHGRGETLSEVQFIANGKGFLPGMPAMKNTIMLYPYGRFCNAAKFAGETDIFESLAAVKKNYSINNDGIIVRGFSMGGASVWQSAVHFPDQWLAVNPGAGFAETFEFLKMQDKQTLVPTWYERRLWHLYDCTDYASNLSNLPLISYSGEIDPQRQAANIMDKAIKTEGLTLFQIIGPKTAHAYEKGAAKTTDSLLNIIAAKGKNAAPKELHFSTYTLKYNKMYWLTVDALQEQWSKGRVDGSIDGSTVSLKTSGVTGLSLNLSILSKLLPSGKPVSITLDGSTVNIRQLSKTGSLSFHSENRKWAAGSIKAALAKKHDLQGPVDDAFMSAFIVVRPTGKSSNELFDQWSKSEMDRFITQWRRQFRGDAVVKNDNELSPADYSTNLILFGDAESNKAIAKISGKLPIKWNSTSIQAGSNSYDSKDHGLIMVYPNPLNQKRYVVLNSGFTFREDAFLNNSRQIPMLPDWAVVDLKTAPGPIYPGKIENAGFFGEKWEWKKPD